MSSLSKQWEGIWSALRVLDFKEGDLPQDNDDANDKHAKFINILVRYLEFCKKEKQQPLLNKLTLHMRYLFGDEDAIIRKLLSNSLDRNVKELDISLKSKQQEVECCYCLSRTVLMKAKYLTTLKMEYLRIKEIESAETEPLCPSLKSLFVKTVHFDNKALSYLVSGCPVVEYLSLTSCSFDTYVLHVSSCSLRKLEVKNCDVENIEVDKSMSLESFTFVSKFPLLQSISLVDTINLNHIKIRGQHLTYLGLFGCHDQLNATVNTPSLHHLDIHAHPTAKVSVKAPNLWLARITLEEQELSTLNWSRKYFATFCDFLTPFCSKNIILVIRDFKDFDATYKSGSSSSVKSELQKYLDEERLDRKKKEFDVLSWWKMEQLRYLVLGHLARDMLAIPISTVAPESAFSIAGRVLDLNRSSLLSETVQALLCCRDWLFGKKDQHHTD